MGKNLLIISEQEKKEIKKLHKLDEQEEFFKSLINTFLGGEFDFFGKSGDTKDDKRTEKEKKVDNKKSSNSLEQKVDFRKITKKIIDNLEGGYYNPEWHYKPIMGKSGETLFGIDRKNGGTLNTGPAGIKFWNLVDKNKNKSTWTYNYRGGSLESELTDLVVDIMEPHYNSLANTYLTPESKKIVENDERLLFHFIYGSWNGPGWFQTFAKKFNDAVKKGITNPDELSKIAVDSRIYSGNSLIARGGKKIDKLFDTIG
jgi:hypothetical protein